MQKVDPGNFSEGDATVLSSAELQSNVPTTFNDPHKLQMTVKEIEDGNISDIPCNNEPVSDQAADEKKCDSTKEPLTAEEHKPVHKKKTVSQSASETLLDQLEDLVHREPETTEDEEDEEEVNEEVEIKGVTRVTVNIPMKES